MYFFVENILHYENHCVYLLLDTIYIVFFRHKGGL